MYRKTLTRNTSRYDLKAVEAHIAAAPHGRDKRQKFHGHHWAQTQRKDYMARFPWW